MTTELATAQKILPCRNQEGERTRPVIGISKLSRMASVADER